MAVVITETSSYVFYNQISFNVITRFIPNTKRIKLLLTSTQIKKQNNKFTYVQNA